jgi:hypothetical protein
MKATLRQQSMHAVRCTTAQKLEMREARDTASSYDHANRPVSIGIDSAIEEVSPGLAKRAPEGP